MSDYLYKSKVNSIHLGSGLIGFVFCGTLAFWTGRLAWLSQETESMYVTWFIAGIFGVFAVWSLGSVILVKIIGLTQEELIIQRPVLGYTLSIKLIEIERVMQQQYAVKSSHNGNI